jgi:hypothetical protein
MAGDGKEGCNGCEIDVDNMARMLRQKGFASVRTLITADATQANVLKQLRTAANQLVAGDLFVFYYSGHGGQRTDQDGDENDRRDETLCLWDGELNDDRLFNVWQAFAPGVRIVSISDACNSGTAFALVKQPGMVVAVKKFFHMTPLTVRAASKMNAALIHLAAAMDSTDARGDDDGGRFTKALLHLLQAPHAYNTYLGLFEQIRLELVHVQRPQITPFGPGGEALLAERPFLI